jgi:hypothetical protein
LVAGTPCKNRDKQLTFIVRVSCWAYFKTVSFIEIILSASYLKIQVNGMNCPDSGVAHEEKLFCLDK